MPVELATEGLTLPFRFHRCTDCRKVVDFSFHYELEDGTKLCTKCRKKRIEAAGKK